MKFAALALCALMCVVVLTWAKYGYGGFRVPAPSSGGLGVGPRQRCKLAYGQGLSKGWVPLPNGRITNQGWFKVTDTNFVYSAYSDGGVIRIIGATSASSSDRLHCQIWYNSTRHGTVSMETSIAQVDTIPENHDKRVTATYYICDISSDSTAIPYAVSLVGRNPCVKPTHVLSIHAPPTSTSSNTSATTFAVCVSPLVYSYNKTRYLVEWLELNRIFGANRFYFYNHDSTSHVQNVLSYYSDLGIVRVLPWNIPSDIHPLIDIHYFGQLAALNDCMYRNKGKHSYIVVTDLDEFIVPRRADHLTWKGMIEGLPNASAYVFCNTFFKTDLPRPQTVAQRQEDNRWNLTTDVTNNLLTMSTLQRQIHILGYNDRSKYMVKPETAETIGIHIVHSYREGGYHIVDTHIGLLHHYRIWNELIYITVDSTMLKYGDMLWKNVMSKWDRLLL